jgi:hypothetical protein
MKNVNLEENASIKEEFHSVSAEGEIDGIDQRVNTLRKNPMNTLGLLKMSEFKSEDSHLMINGLKEPDSVWKQSSMIIDSTKYKMNSESSSNRDEE